MTVQDHSASATDVTTRGVVLSDTAVAMVKELLAKEGRDDLRLRIQVTPAGCQGLSYQLFFDDRTLDGDVISGFDGVEVVVDPASVDKVDGAIIDFVDQGLQGAGFQIDNPNETSRCACGDSFC
jgi:iron-sulfur cluster assembly accessory protein